MTRSTRSLHGGDQAIRSTAGLVFAMRGAGSEGQQAAAQAASTAYGLGGMVSPGAEDAGGASGTGCRANPSGRC